MFVRWHHFIGVLGVRFSLRNLDIYLAAFALTLTPGKAGETIRSVYLHPYEISYRPDETATIANIAGVMRLRQAGGPGNG